jgi:hypothetical protein
MDIVNKKTVIYPKTFTTITQEIATVVRLKEADAEKLNILEIENHKSQEVVKKFSAKNLAFLFDYLIPAKFLQGTEVKPQHRNEKTIVTSKGKSS